MKGRRLEGDFHLIHGETARFQNSIRCVKECGIGVDEIVASCLASAQAVLNQQQMKSGALVVDIGGGVTDYIVYLDGAVCQSGTIEFGGDDITTDIAIGLSLPIHVAEKLKIEEGSAILGKSLTGEKFILRSDTGFSGKEVEREILNGMIHTRLEDLFSRLRKRLPLPRLDAGVLLTGGCSKIRGIREMAESVLEIPTHLAHAHAISGLASLIENPQFSTCLGLIKYGIDSRRIQDNWPGSF